MTLRALFLLGLLAACSSADSDPSSTSEAGAATKPPSSAHSPPVGTDTPLADGGPPPSGATTTIRVHYAGNPGALTIRGTANGLTWEADAPLAVEGTSTFTWKSTAVTAAFEAKPLLAGEWAKGPNYRVVPGASIDIYPRFKTETGAYERKWPAFQSTALPSTRGIWVYLPPTYLENTESRLPVVYMHDGQNLFSSATAYGGNEWKVDETFDAGAGDGSIDEAIVIGIESTSARISELTPTPDPENGGGNLSAYLTMLRQEIKPLVDTTFRTHPERETTTMIGASLGGLATAYAGVFEADLFATIGVMSPSVWWDRRMILGEIPKTPATPRPSRVYVDCGDDNDGRPDADQLANAYRTLGYIDGKDLEYVVQAGGKHSEIAWAQRLPHALSMMLGKRKDLR